MAALFASGLVEHAAGGEAVIALVLILVVTMTLSDFMNNAATAAVMCPIAISTAGSLGGSADPLLMAVAVGTSCAFLTPIGHQNNTLILGPGGFRFGDYWRLGLPLEMLVVARSRADDPVGVAAVTDLSSSASSRPVRSGARQRSSSACRPAACG